LGLDLCELGRKSECRYIREMQTYLDHCKTIDYIVRHEAVQKMRVGPSESACRS